MMIRYTAMGIFYFIIVPLASLAIGLFGLVLVGSALLGTAVRQRVMRGLIGLVLITCSASYFAYAWTHLFVG